MIFKNSRKRKIAFVFLCIWVLNIFAPVTSYALTSGPAQPEMQSFQPAGVSDMVDLSTGDFKYNIPLLDIDGYPLNLNYESGVGMDDEASWVGLGWNLNVGAVNRQLRGLPDDFSGDKTEIQQYTKPKITVGGKLTGKVEVRGKTGIKGGPTGSLTIGVFSDNYTGVGAEIGANAGMSFSLANSGALTTGMGLGVTSNTSSGVDLSPYVSLSLSVKASDKSTASIGGSASLGYNTRSGMKELSLNSSFGIKGNDEWKFAIPFYTTILEFSGGGQGGLNFSPAGSSISYNTEPISPSIQYPYKSTYGSFSIDVGGVAWIVFGGGGGTGYKSVREVARNSIFTNGYGFLYSEKGIKDKDASMDFIREKDNPIIPELPNLALPVHTPDLFSFTSQAGSGQFRLYRGTGAFLDNEMEDESYISTLGGDAGIGAYAHGGLTKFDQVTTNVTRRWRNSDNAFLKKGEFQSYSYAQPVKEHVFFRQVGEKSREDKNLSDQLLGTKPLAVNIQGIKTLEGFRDNANDFSSSIAIPNAIEKKGRQSKRTVISYLTAAEASKSGFEKLITKYPFNLISDTGEGLKTKDVASTEVRETTIRKGHHISEVTVTADDGKRTIYGIPVYNKTQDEYSFAVGTHNTVQAGKGNIVEVQYNGDAINHKQGIDHYYRKEKKPAYATSFLQTAILSSDYADRSGDGISDDDLGTALKFKYSKIDDYQWRAPYDGATLNRGLLADPDDDKASIVYGTKELWYSHSIESKNRIVYFITEDREDGQGVHSWKGGWGSSSGKQKRLKEIRLYNKLDRSKPIKVVKFEYSYELCPGVPNSKNPVALNTPNGKLTLKKVHFEYGNTKKGANHPYEFTYKQSAGTVEDGYRYMSTDRWGVFKPNTTGQNAPFNLANDEFPYTIQNKPQLDANVALWHLSKIELPTGGTINVDYESDDYAFVQNKRAMVMSGINSLIVNKNGSTTYIPLFGVPRPVDLSTARGLKVPVSTAPASNEDHTRWFRNNYLDRSGYLYVKMRVKISTPNSKSKGADWEFVPVYCKVKEVQVQNGYANVIFENVNEAGLSINPMIHAAWQRLKLEYPRYAYPGYDTRVSDNSAGKAIKSAVSAIFNAARNLSELKENFYKKANRKGYATAVQMDKSFVRLVEQNGIKLGGGCRVKKIRMVDNWKAMAGVESTDAGYGQAYEYTSTYNGKTISSGVAAYEPSIGGDENPLKQPVSYVQKIKGGINNFFELEEPFGESFFPGPSIIYSKVTVRDLDKNGEPDSEKRTGYVVNEYYTARDFPVRVTVLPIDPYEYRPKSTFSMFNSSSIHELCFSQGYSIELNDMHGKAKAIRVYNQSGSEIASTVYEYNVDDPKAIEKKLKNKVQVVNEDGTVDQDVVMGREIEFFTDFRQQESNTTGESINLGVDVVPGIFAVPIPIPHFPFKENSDYKLFRSVSAVKVVQYYGILDKVTKTENGSSISTENVAYDGLTGEALVTKTQNEFKQDIYSVNLPAYWVYKGMGAAGKNLGLVLQNLQASSNGILLGQTYYSLLQAGDEAVDVKNGNRYWVIETSGAKRLINRDGTVYTNKISLAKIVRSGYRNNLLSQTSSLVCMANPIQLCDIDPSWAVNMKPALKIREESDLSNLKVINASVQTFDETSANLPKGPIKAGWIEQRDVIENTSIDFNYCHQPGITGDNITFPSSSSPYNDNTSNYWRNLRNRATVKACSEDFTYIGTKYCLQVPKAGTYYIAGCTYGMIRVYIRKENQIVYYYYGTSSDNVFIREVNFPNAGSYDVEITSEAAKTGVDESHFAFEIYDNLESELINADVNITSLKKIFTTFEFIENNSLNNCKFNNFYGTIYNRFTKLSGASLAACEIPDSYIVFNPFVTGYLDLWRPYKSCVYQGGRIEKDLFNPQKKGVQIKESGFFTDYFSYWKHDGSSWLNNTSATKWKVANTVTLYDKYGQELENKDALGRFKAAKFDFNSELPSAVASNSMNRELYSNSLEDYNSRKLSYEETEFKQLPDLTESISKGTMVNSAHTGKTAVTVPVSGFNINTKVHGNEHKTVPYFSFTQKNEYKLVNTTNIYPNGFEPKPNKKYIFTAWVKDSSPGSKNLSLDYSVNGASQSEFKCKAIVEGWKLIECSFTTGAVNTDLSFTIKPKTGAGTVYLDDIRIHPYDAQMKTYAYHPVTFKLMAELDENCFATLYEYDDEGQLARVKKETERGIITLKESRSSYKKKP